MKPRQPEQIRQPIDRFRGEDGGDFTLNRIDPDDTHDRTVVAAAARTALLDEQA